MNGSPSTVPHGVASGPRWRRRLRGIVFGIGCAIVALAGLELGLRATGAVLQASRNRTHAPDEGERVFTILCAGDSWTQGAPYGTYPDFLVERLNAGGRGVRFRQFNVGLAGTNSSQALARLPEEIATYHPDLLLVLTGNNDHHNLTDSTYWRFADHALGRSSILVARARVFAHSLRVWRLGRTLWQQARGGATPNRFFEAGRAVADRDGLIAIDAETHRRQLEYNLTRTVDLARREQLPLVFQTYFHFHGYHVNEVVREVATRYGVPLVDHNRLVHTRLPPAERDRLRIEDGHPNARGYDLMAAQIIEVLDANELVPPPASGASR